MATSISVKYGVPEVREKTKSAFKAHLVVEELFKIGGSGRPDNGRILASVIVDKGLFSTKVCVLSKFGGDTTQKLAQYAGRPDSLAVNLNVKDRTIEVRAADKAVIDTIEHKALPDDNVPKGVDARKGDFFVKAEGPLQKVMAYLATVDEFISRPALEIIAAAMKELASPATGWKPKNGTKGNGQK
jgi:hypothetical protein